MMITSCWESVGVSCNLVARDESWHKRFFVLGKNLPIVADLQYFSSGCPMHTNFAEFTKKNVPKWTKNSFKPTEKRPKTRKNILPSAEMLYNS